MQWWQESALSLSKLRKIRKIEVYIILIDIRIYQFQSNSTSLFLGVEWESVNYHWIWSDNTKIHSKLWTKVAQVSKANKRRYFTTHEQEEKGKTYINSPLQNGLFSWRPRNFQSSTTLLKTNHREVMHNRISEYKLFTVHLLSSRP